MTQDKSTKRPWQLPVRVVPGMLGSGGFIYDADDVCVANAPSQEWAALIVSAVNAHDAMQECVEALKALIAHTKAWERLTAEEAGHEPCLSDPLVDAIAALAKLEKAHDH